MIIRISDSSTSTDTTTLATALSHGRLRHGPSTSGSLHSSSRKTLAEGSRTPGQRLYGLRDHAERRAGDQHDRGRRGDHAGEDRVEHLGVAEACGAARTVGPEHVAEGVAGGQRQRAGPDQRRVQQDDREEGAGGRAERVVQRFGGGPGVGEVAEVGRSRRRRRPTRTAGRRRRSRRRPRRSGCRCARS